MPTITRLAQGKRDPTRVNLFLDGKFAFSLSADEVIKRGLTKDSELQDQSLRELESLSNQEKLFSKVINFISYRPRSIKEVNDRLYKYLGKGEEEVKSSMIDRLKELGYLDDEAFAKWFVESRSAHRPRSKRHLASELYSKGIDKVIIDNALASSGDEKEALKKLIAKKKNMEHDKLVAFLARRGFPWTLIKSELDKEGANE